MKKAKIMAAVITLMTILISIIPPLNNIAQSKDEESKQEMNRDSVMHRMYSSLWQIKKINDSADNSLQADENKLDDHTRNFSYYKKRLLNFSRRKPDVIVKVKQSPADTVVIREHHYIYKDEKGRVIGYDSIAPVIKKTFWQKLFRR